MRCDDDGSDWGGFDWLECECGDEIVLWWAGGWESNFVIVLGVAV